MPVFSHSNCTGQPETSFEAFLPQENIGFRVVRLLEEVRFSDSK
jgi:hypothetical protein